jgi:hypothetical protein
VQNLFNTVNPGTPIGNLSSPFFGEPVASVAGFGGGGMGGGPGGIGGGSVGGGGSAGNRRIELQARLGF